MTPGFDQSALKQQLHAAAQAGNTFEVKKLLQGVTARPVMVKDLIRVMEEMQHALGYLSKLEDSLRPMKAADLSAADRKVDQRRKEAYNLIEFICSPVPEKYRK
jgi:hypothetical protein